MNVIEVENLSKKFKLGVYGGKTLRDDFSAWMAKMRGKENPLITIGDQSRVDVKGEFWALRNINFSVKQGEVLGIIGKNGAGKSTLLKLLSRISYPTSGEIRIKGRIASLLEVGTGFHPELTGRENVFLNGAILGMTRKDILLKFDEIVAFSGIEHHIDTPVKRYSSGMKVRLGFAVAAYLEPEILIVDEVLAVGDAEFQRKCIGKMQDVAGNGRTVLFVSHNLASVKALCNNAILLDQGKYIMDGTPDHVISQYIKTSEENLPLNVTSEKQFDFGFGKLISFGVFSDRKNNFISMDEGFKISISYSVERNLPDLFFVIHILNEESVVIFGTSISDIRPEEGNHDVGKYFLTCNVPPHLLNSGFYSMRLIVSNNNAMVKKWDNFFSFQIEEDAVEGRTMFSRRAGMIRPQLEWIKEKIG